MGQKSPLAPVGRGREPSIIIMLVTDLRGNVGGGGQTSFPSIAHVPDAVEVFSWPGRPWERTYSIITMLETIRTLRRSEEDIHKCQGLHPHQMR